MVVRAYWMSRFGSVIPAGVVAYAAISVVVQSPITAEGLLVSFLLVGVPLFLVIRAFRAGVVLREGDMTIRGWWWSRSITRAQAVDVRLGWLRWHTARGGRRRSPLAIFWNFGDWWFAPLSAHNELAVLTIQRWIDERDRADVASGATNARGRARRAP